MIQIFTHLIVYKEMCLVIWFVVCKYLSAICIRFLQMMSMKQTCNVNDAKSIFMGKTINFPKGFIVSLFFAFSNVSFIFFSFQIPYFSSFVCFLIFIFSINILLYLAFLHQQFSLLRFFFLQPSFFLLLLYFIHFPSFPFYQHVVIKWTQM